MSDLIKRSDAIEAMCGNCGWRETQCDPDERFWCEDGTKIRRDIPSAEITHDDVMQYCNSRLLVLATVESIKHQYRIGFEDGKASADRPQGEWIPCEERLPEPYTGVLVCDDYGWIALGVHRPCDVSEDCSGWSIHTGVKIGTEEVIAWMPLPEPWKGADDE